MAVNRPRGDDDLTELPWASVFDPAANARALSAIQAQGFRAASRVVDRFAEIAGGVTGAPTAARTTGDGGGPATPALNPDVDLVITTWWTIVGQMFRAMRGETTTTDSRHPASVDVATGVATGSVRLDAGDTAEVWVHNSGSDDVADTVPRCSDLLAHDGGVIGSAAVRFTPDVVPLPARSSRGVGVHVDVGEDVEAGSYRGTILLTGHPDVWLPIVVAVPVP
jgi:hypothetical protein